MLDKHISTPFFIQVLLGMSDSDLASALEIKNHLHRKKLRLAIEEQRNLTVG